MHDVTAIDATQRLLDPEGSRDATSTGVHTSGTQRDDDAAAREFFDGGYVARR
jgi:hypothetical protein